MTTLAHLYRLIQDTSGNLEMASASISVNVPGDDEVISDTLYADNAAVTPLDNPFTIDNGVIDFYLEDAQRVDIVVVVGSNTTTYSDVDVLVPITLEEGDEYQGAWDISTSYDLGNLVIGSDNFLYVSQVGENVGNDPTTDGGVNWSAKPSSGGGSGTVLVGNFSFAYGAFSAGTATGNTGFDMSGDDIYTVTGGGSAATVANDCNIASTYVVTILTDNLTAGQLVVVNVSVGDGILGNAVNSVMIGNGSTQEFEFSICSTANEVTSGTAITDSLTVEAHDATTGDAIDTDAWQAGVNSVLVAVVTA